MMLNFNQRLKAIHFDFAELPAQFKDCVHLGIIENPVILSDGFTYDECTAVDILSRPLVQRKSPITREDLDKHVLIKNHSLKSLIIDFIETQEKLHQPCVAIAQEYKKKIIELKQTIDTSNKQSKSALNKANKEIKSLRKQSEQLTSNLSKKDERIHSLQQQLNQSLKANKDLKHQLSALRNQAEVKAESKKEESWLSLFGLFTSHSQDHTFDNRKKSSNKNAKFDR